MRSTFMKENGSDVRYAIALALALLTVLSMVAIASASPSDADDSAMSGTCGTDLNWELTANDDVLYTHTYTNIKGDEYERITTKTWIEFNSNGEYTAVTTNVDTQAYTLTISGSGTVMENYKMTSLPPWMDLHLNVTQIVLPDSLTNIGDYAFIETNISSIKLPESLTSIGSSAFNICRSLSSIEIPASVTSIGSSAFAACTDLTDVNLSELVNLTTIGASAFESTALTSANLQNTQLTTIVDAAFQYVDNGTSSLRTLSIPEGSALTTIGEKAFNDCGLTSVDLSNATGLESIGKDAFGNCSSLTTVTLPDSVNFTEDAFSGSTIQFSLDIGYDDMTFFLSGDSGTVEIKPKGTMGVSVILTVDNPEIATVSGSTLTINATGTTEVTATATYNDETYTDSFALTVVQSPDVEGLTFLPMTDSMETAINQVVVPNVPMTDFVESTLVNIEPSEGSEVGAISYDVLGWSIDSSNFDDYVYYAVHYTGTCIYTPEIVSVTATSQGLEVGFNGFSPYMFGYTVKAVEPGPTPGYDDDEELPPFIPAQPKDSGDDVTIVACAAAAVVAALMAVFLIVSYKKD